MEIKQYISLEIKKNDHTFTFMMPQGSTWGASIDAAFEVLQKVNELSQNAISAAQPQKVQE